MSSKHTRKQPMRFALLMLTCAIIFFVIAIYNRGPRFSFAPAQDPHRLSPTTTLIRLKSNIQLNTEQVPIVNIEPEILAEASVDAFGLLVTLKEPLRYDTTYTMQVDNALSTTGKTAGTRLSFSTRPIELYYAQRIVNIQGQLQDAVYYQKRPHTHPQLLYSAPAIVHFAASNQDLLVVERQQEITHIVHQSKNGKKRTIHQVDGGVSLISSATNSNLFAFSTQDSQEGHGLWIYDAYTQSLNELVSPDGKPIQASSVRVNEDGASILYTTYDGLAYLDNPLDTTKPLPLGSVLSVVGFTDNGSTLIVEQSQGYAYIEARTGIAKPADTTFATFNQLAVAYKNSDVYAGVDSVLSEDLQVEQHVRYVLSGEIKTIETASLQEKNFSSFKVSTNSQYLAYEQAIAPVQYDNYPGNSKPVEVETILRDSANGEVVQTIKGFDLQWR